MRLFKHPLTKADRRDGGLKMLCVPIVYGRATTRFEMQEFQGMTRSVWCDLRKGRILQTYPLLCKCVETLRF